MHRSYTFYTQTTFICKNPDLYSNTPQLKWKCQSTKISWGGGAVFDDQRFASFYQTFCYKISWNYLKFWGRESEQSLILNLNPSPSEKNCVKSCIFARKRTSFTQIFLGEAPRPHPSSTSSTVFWHYVENVEKKEEIKRYKQTVASKNDVLNPITPPPLFFACWNLRSEVRNPPPLLPEKIFWIGACMHSTQFFKSDFHMVSGVWAAVLT